MTFSTKKLGDLGESTAIDYLKKQGYQILEKNYIPKFGDLSKTEIDIIAKKGEVIVFVEVKTISVNSPFFPQDKVNYFKQRKIIKAAKMYLSEKKLFDSPCQINIIALKIDLNTRKAKIRHLENIISEF